MWPIDFPGSNRVFTAPKGKEEEVLPIHAVTGKFDNGEPYTRTLWQPSKEDLEAINAGRGIVLEFPFDTMPPVLLFTFDEEGKFNL